MMPVGNVKQTNAQMRHAVLGCHEGYHLLSAQEVILKSVLESESRIALIAGPKHDPFQPVFGITSIAAISELMARHETEIVPTHDAGRAVRLAMYAAQSGQKALALVPNSMLDQTIAGLTEASIGQFEKGGAVCLILEDHPEHAPASCPRRAAFRLGLPCLEPRDIAELRHTIENALRLSRAGGCPIALVLHCSILQSASTMEVKPNRVPNLTDVVLPSRRRSPKPRWGETGGVLRMARRLELNRFRALPSPGERIPVGFITVGPADSSMLHLAGMLGLQGRIPVLNLGMIYPLDELAVERILNRCEQVVILEPRPGTIEMSVMSVAEILRRRGQRPASVWGQMLPPSDIDEEILMESDVDLHPSVLVRKIIHLLHLLRPGFEIVSALNPDVPGLSVDLPPRSSAIGSDASLAVVREMIEATDRWLVDQAPLEVRNIPETALSRDGRKAVRPVSRIVRVETWGHRRFQYEGIAALIQAANDNRPWVFMICETTDEDGQDLERLARGAIPSDRAARVHIENGNLDDQAALLETLHIAVLSDDLTIIIVRDGPPPRYDITAIERGMMEIDRLGYQPRHRLVRFIDYACSLHQTSSDLSVENRSGREPKGLETNISVDHLSRRTTTGPRMRLKPMFEQIEVIRTRSPARIWQSEKTSRLPIPTPLHGSRSLWRAHLAGYRSRSPGVTAMVLCEAGRLMGYAVKSRYNPTPIGAGRRAWAEILFTQTENGESSRDVSVAVPYGEADLLLGMDVLETFRSIGPDPVLRVADVRRTGAIVNLGLLSDEQDNEQSAEIREKFIHCAKQCILEKHQHFGDFATACRRAFHSDRVVDVAMIGAAYQHGLIPVTLDAIKEALKHVEMKGYGGTEDAFDFGRRLAVHPELFTRQKAKREEGVGKIARRMELSLARSRWWGNIQASRFRGLVQRSLKAMPGLAETDAGRKTRRLFVIALHRCLIWGGFDYAERYCDLITQLYLADRGDQGRLITRDAILPLAEAMLIRDPIYMAAMVCSPEQRRRTRQQLNVKLARGDRVELRYLTRLEIMFREKRFRMDLKTSDWAARLIASLRRIIPLRWRGTIRNRKLRAYVEEFVRRTTIKEMHDYEATRGTFTVLHELARENRLRGMTAGELKLRLEAEIETVATQENKPT